MPIWTYAPRSKMHEPEKGSHVREMANDLRKQPVNDRCRASAYLQTSAHLFMIRSTMAIVRWQEQMDLYALRLVGAVLFCATAILMVSGCSWWGNKTPAGPATSSAITLNYLDADEDLGGVHPTCGTPKQILVKEPSAPGSYPVLVFLVGTWGRYDSNWVTATLDGAAKQGFVAASADYHADLRSLDICEHGWYKTRCMFSTSFNAQSALAAVCADPKADCAGLGLVVAGFSQGGAQAAMARNFDTRIRGAWTMGFGGLEPCTREGGGALGSASSRILKNDRLRVFRGGHEGIPVEWSNEPTGLNCPAGTWDCLLGANQSGWYYPPDTEVTSALNPNEHCFMQANPLDSQGHKVNCGDTIDPRFVAVPPATTYTSGLYQNLQWLKNTILPLGVQP